MNTSPKQADDVPIMVKEVQIIGITVFKETDLLNKIEITAGLNTSQKIQSIVDLDKKRLKQEYLNNGYWKAAVLTPDEKTLLSDDGKIVFTLYEGVQYKVGEIKFSGDFHFPESDLKKWLTLKKDEIYTYPKLLEYLAILSTKYKEVHYPFVDASPKMAFDDTNKTITTTFEIQKNTLQK